MAKSFKLPAWLRPVKGAVPVSSIPAKDLPAVNQAVREERALVQTLRYRGRVSYFVIFPDTPSSTAETQQ